MNNGKDLAKCDNLIVLPECCDITIPGTGEGISNLATAAAKFVIIAQKGSKL